MNQHQALNQGNFLKLLKILHRNNIVPIHDPIVILKTIFKGETV